MKLVKPKMFEAENRNIYLLVNKQEILIKERKFDRIGARSGQKVIWRICVPNTVPDSPWACVNYVAHKYGALEPYASSHQKYIPACDITRLRIELEKRIKTQLPQVAFDRFESLQIISKLI